MPKSQPSRTAIDRDSKPPVGTREALSAIWWISLAVVGLLLLAPPASAATLYVDLNSTNPTPPYADLSTAAVSIQTAVDAATNGDLVLVNDGIYQTGGDQTASGFGYYQSNKVVICKRITVQSLNGPAAAGIDGSGICRCVFLTNGAWLNGFTLTNGFAGYLSGTGRLATGYAGQGGGVAGSTVAGGVVSNCVITANTAPGGTGGGAFEVTLMNCTLTNNSAGNGGGAALCTATGCLIVGNQATVTVVNFVDGPLPGEGGGLYGGSAVNCLLAGNSAVTGGGAYGVLRMVNCTIASNLAGFEGGYCPASVIQPYELTNCLIYFNTAATNRDYGNGSTCIFDHCCVPVLPAGVGNITNDPAFVNAAAGDYRLRSNSPCINAGWNCAVTATNDLSGSPRIAGGAVDIGAYEYPAPASVLSYAWAQQYGLPTDGSADFQDMDGTGMNNWQKWVAGLNPTNPASVLALSSVNPRTATSSAKVTWQSVTNRTYFLQRSTNLLAQPAFSTIQSNLVGGFGSTTCMDATATNCGPYYYRVGVQ